MHGNREPIGVTLLLAFGLAGNLSACLHIDVPESDTDSDGGERPAVAPPELFPAATNPTRPPDPVDPRVANPTDPTVVDPEAIQCAFDASAGNAGVMALLVDDEVRLVRADGTHDLLLTMGGEWADAAESWVNGTLVARGSYAAASRVAGLDVSGPYGSPRAYGSEVALFDRSGAVLAHTATEGPAYGYYNVLLNERGELLAHNGQTALLLTPNGIVATLDDVHPVTEVLPDGHFLSYVYEGAYGPVRYEWVDVRTDERTPLDPQPEGAYAFHTAGGRLTFVDQYGDSEAHLVAYEGSREVQRLTIPLPEGTWGAELLDLVEAGHALLGSPYEGERWLADLERGSVAPLSLVLPAGLEMVLAPAGYYYVPPQPMRLDEDGGLLVALHDGELSRLHRTADGGTTWTPIGGTMAATDFSYAVGVGGTYVIRSSDARCHYCAPNEEPEPADLPEPQVASGQMQVVRPSAGVAWLLPEESAGVSQWEPILTEDGRCLGYWQTDEVGSISLSTLEVETGHQTRLLSLDPAAGEGNSGRAAAWFHGSQRSNGLWYY